MLPCVSYAAHGIEDFGDRPSTADQQDSAQRYWLYGKTIDDRFTRLITTYTCQPTLAILRTLPISKAELLLGSDKPVLANWSQLDDWPIAFDSTYFGSSVTLSPSFRCQFWGSRADAFNSVSTGDDDFYEPILMRTVSFSYSQSRYAHRWLKSRFLRFPILLFTCS